MYKLKLILLSILISTSAFAQQNSPTISELNEKITLLETKVDVLNDANKKILRTVIGTLAIILTFFVGVGVANYLSNQKLNNQKFDNYTSKLDEKFAQLNKSTTESILNVQKEWKTEFTEYEKKGIELVLNKTSEVQESMSKSLDSQINHKLYRLEINIAKSKLRTLKLEHKRGPLEHKVDVLERKLDKSGFRPIYSSYYVDDFNRIIEMCYLSLKIEIAERQTLPIEVKRHLKLLNEFLKNNPINSRMNDSLTNLIGALSNSQYDFRDSIRVINSSVKRSSDIPLV